MICENCGGTGLVPNSEEDEDITCPICDGQCEIEEEELHASS